LVNDFTLAQTDHIKPLFSGVENMDFFILFLVLHNIKKVQRKIFQETKEFKRGLSQMLISSFSTKDCKDGVQA